MRNGTLHALLEQFTADVAFQLTAATSRGEEVPFEVVETASAPRGRTSLYCYRPLTTQFIGEQLGRLSGLTTYAPAARAVGDTEGVAAYLREQGVEAIPEDPRARADAVLHAFLATVFSERDEFEFDVGRFEAAYAKLERALYVGRCVATVIAPLLGVALDEATTELALGDGLSLVRGDASPDAPPEAVWGEGDEPHVLAELTIVQERSARSPVPLARARFRRILSALRLFQTGGYALGPLAWARTDSGAWRPLPLGTRGRPRLVTFISAAHEDELRAFCNLIARRVPAGGEIAWALARFEMGCERVAPFEALTDYLIALRALLEPEGPASGRLAQRLAVICARPEDRAALAERVAHAISLERAVIAGLAPAEPGVDALVGELAEHLRALLRDVLCGHLDADLCQVADDLLVASAGAQPQQDVVDTVAERPRAR